MNKDKELERALNFHRAGQKNEASAIYDSILKHDPCHSDSWHLKGLLLYDEGRLDEAEAIFQQDIRHSSLPFFYDRLSDKAVVLLDDAAREGEKDCVNKWLNMYPGLNMEYADTEKGAVIIRKAV